MRSSCTNPEAPRCAAMAKRTFPPGTAGRAQPSRSPGKNIAYGVRTKLLLANGAAVAALSKDGASIRRRASRASSRRSVLRRAHAFDASITGLRSDHRHRNPIGRDRHCRAWCHGAPDGWVGVQRRAAEELLRFKVGCREGVAGHLPNRTRNISRRADEAASASCELDSLQTRATVRVRAN